MRVIHLAIQKEGELSVLPRNAVTSSKRGSGMSQLQLQRKHEELKS